MRTKTLSVLNILLLLSIMAVVVASSGALLLMVFSVATCCIYIATLISWLLYVSDMTKQSTYILNTENHIGKLSFKNMRLIKENLDLISQKFHSSANLISNLSFDTTVLQELTTVDRDVISQALYKLKVEMKRIKEEEEKRRWIEQGLSKFTEILSNRCEQREYCATIITNLAKYINAYQGGLFIEYQNENELSHLEFASGYACNADKEANLKIYSGQGILGQCIIERDFVFIDKIPKDYIKVSSGLGASTPRNLVVAPLLFNDTFYGAIELAFFEPLKQHQVDFLKRICENIASEISALKNIQNTKGLLTESNELATQLKKREDEMKRGMAELAATQEEMSRKQAELTSVINAIDVTLATAEFDINGQFKNANDIFLKILGYKAIDLEEKSFDYFMGIDPTSVMMWENLRLGKFFSGEFKMHDRSGKEVWLSGTFNPIIIQGKIPEKIMMFAQFTTQEKEKVNDLSTIVQAFKSSFPVLELSDQFICKTANEKFLKLFEINKFDLRSKSILDFMGNHYHADWKMKLREMLAKDSVTLKLPIAIGSRIVTYEISMLLIKNLEGRISRIIMLFIKEVAEEVPVLIAL